MTKLFRKIAKSVFWQATLTSFLLTALFLSNFLFNLDKALIFSDGTLATSRLSHGDISHVTLTLKHYFDIFLTGNFSNILNVPIFYGFENTLLYSEPFFLHALVGFPIFLLTKNVLVTFNLLAYLSIVTSFFSMFLLGSYFTKRYFPSTLAAIIFVFNPFIFARFPEHITYYTLTFIPLIFLYIEKSLKEPKSLNTFMVFLLMSLQLLTTLTFGVLLSIVLPIYSLIRYFQLKPKLKKYFNWGTLLGLILLISIALDFGFIYNKLYSKEPINRTLVDTEYYSAWVSDIFLASPRNLVYGSVRDNLATAFPNAIFLGPEITERNLFWGLTVITLFILSFKLLRRGEHKKIWLASLTLVILTLLLSLGPQIHFTYDSAIPGLYQIAYFLNPFLHYLRVASRFSFFTFLFLGIISALVLSKITEHQKYKKALVVSLVIISLVLLEYWNKPWVYQSVSSETRQLYQTLENSNQIKVILELPMGNLSTPLSSARYQFVDSDYMLSASTLHSKKLINGYSSYIPPKYTQRVEYLSINFPNPIKLQAIKKWGADAIVLHKNNYKDPQEYDRIVNSLRALQVKELFSTSNQALFALTDWQSKL